MRGEVRGTESSVLKSKNHCYRRINKVEEIAGTGHGINWLRAEGIHESHAHIAVYNFCLKSS